MGMMSISYPARTAFFCSSIFIFCRSLIFRLILRIAVAWSIDWICRLTVTASSRSRNSASIRSVSSGAKICKKDMAPEYSPMRKVLPSLEKVKLVGAIKSFVERPVLARSLQANLNFSWPLGWSWLCRSSSRSSPLNGTAWTPRVLKLFSTSVSTRSSRILAVRRSSASMPKVIYLRLARPLLPFSSWFLSISAYSRRMSSYSSPWGGIAMLLEKSCILARWLIKVSWTLMVESK